jgi:hypothetical protein
VYVYASLGRYAGESEAAWNAEFGLEIAALPRGVLVGTVEIVGCRPLALTDSKAACFEILDTEGLFGWQLARPERADELVKPTKHPQPVWFNPF